MPLTLVKRIPLGRAITFAEEDANKTATETEVNAKATTTYVDASAAGKVSTTDPRLSDKRVPVDGSYGLFTMAAGVASVVPATEAQMRDGTAGKVPDAAVQLAMAGFQTVTPASGVLTLNWSTLTRQGIRVSLTQTITSIVISNLPSWPVSIVFKSVGSFTVALPAHGSTVDGKTWRYVNNHLLPTPPVGNNTGFLLHIRELDATDILATYGGHWTS